MITFHMETDSVRMMETQFRRVSEQILNQVQALRSAIHSIDWISPGRDEFVFETDSIINLLISQSELGSILAQRIEMETLEWEQVAANLSGFEFIGVNNAGGGLPGISVFSTVIPLYTWFTMVSNSDIPDWVQSQIQKLFGPASIPTPFPEILEPVEMPAEEPLPQKIYDNYYDVKPQAQGKLYGSAACGPTSISMVMDYYHQQDSANATVSPGDIIKGMEDGDGTVGKGVSLSRLDDDIKDFGYSVDWKTKASLDDLKSSLQDGPVIINGKVDLKGQDIKIPGTQVNHSMVVKGISSNKVVINDPWSGTEKAISTNDFHKMWNGSNNVLYIIRP